MTTVRSAATRRRPVPVSDLVALRSHGGAPALVDGDGIVDYLALADRVEERIGELGGSRRVVGVHGDNSIEFVVTYLAALTAGHVVAVLSGRDDPADCDVIVRAPSDSPVVIEAHRSRTTHDLHPDLAVLMTTSGSSGSPKLVRLSKTNVDSNAIAIAECLELHADDCAITSLPLHYCYGLSAVTSHLAVGGCAVLTDTSVVDPCFWQLVEDHAVTTLSGVPYTFDLIDRLPGDPLAVPSLRRVTQAGGRLPAGDVTRLTRLGQRNGWDFVVMYGQTEATARMTYLPSTLTERYPHTIGRPIPGGSITLEPVADGSNDGTVVPADIVDIGEIVYRGPNVMLGYAESPADFARGRDVDALRTGDIGRRVRTGDEVLYEVIGRRSRFIKPFGRRIDLDHVASLLVSAGHDVEVTGTDELLVVAVTGGSFDADLDHVRGMVAARVDLPAAAIAVTAVEELPRLTSGKVDQHALIAQALDERAALSADAADGAPAGVGTTVGAVVGTVTAIFASVLGVDRIEPTDTFSSIGGDSLSYVEVSIRLEQLLGDLPIGWHLLPVGDLDALIPTVPRPNRRTAQVETSVVIRAVGIALIVCTHMHVQRIPGGAHALLAVAGYNFARFQLRGADGPGRLRRGMQTVARVAVPTSFWIGLQMIIAGGYSVGALFLVNNYSGSPWRRDGRWEYWYFEAFVQIFLVLTLLLAVPMVRRVEHRAPFTFAFSLLLATTVVGVRVVEWGDSYNAIYRSHTVVWFVLLGWCAQVSTSVVQRMATTVVLLGAAPFYFDRWQRAAVVIVLIGLLIWVPRLRVPRRIAPMIGWVAAASMVTFLIHWQVWPVFTQVFVREVAFVFTMATGVGVWAAGRWLLRRGRAARSARIGGPVQSGRRRPETAATSSPSERQTVASIR